MCGSSHIGSVLTVIPVLLGHILELEFCHLGCWAVLWKISETTKILLKYATFEGIFQVFDGKKKFKVFFKNILVTALQSYIK